jgi:hypothetical protein
MGDGRRLAQAALVMGVIAAAGAALSWVVAFTPLGQGTALRGVLALTALTATMFATIPAIILGTLGWGSPARRQGVIGGVLGVLALLAVTVPFLAG